MNTFRKKITTFYCLFLLIPFYRLHASQSLYQTQKVDQVVALSREKRKLLVYGYCKADRMPTDLFLLVIYFVYDNPLQYKKKTLPNDLSGEDLSGFDFTECHFTYTNLTNTNLTNVILMNTICDYEKTFLSNIKKNKCCGGTWYQNNLTKDLKSIAAVYPKLNQYRQKAKLLHVACGLSRVPFYEGIEFYIKVYYWSSVLLQLKQELNSLYGDQLICSLEDNIESDKKDNCWTTNYPQEKVTIDASSPHTNFKQYLKDFTSNLTKYGCNSRCKLGFNWYKGCITKSIKGLKKTYPYIKEASLQQEACDIAHALSKSYQIQKRALQYHYILYQNRLMCLKKRISLGKKNKIHYSGRLYREQSWVRSKK